MEHFSWNWSNKYRRILCVFSKDENKGGFFKDKIPVGGTLLVEKTQCLM